MSDLVIDHLTIDRAEALRYLRLPTHLSEQDLPPTVTEQLDRAEQAVLKAAQPRFVWREFPLRHSDSAVILTGTSLTLSGRDIAELLADCHSCIVLAATIGIGCDELIRRHEPIDMGLALMLDAFAGAAVENLCDQVQTALAERFASRNLFLTRRFSPGYGDLPITTQKPLCAALDTARRIGLTVSASGILIPRKSVTAIIGLGETPPLEHSTHDCAHCNMRDYCPYKK